jgi:hypothetical protein
MYIAINEPRQSCGYRTGKGLIYEGRERKMGAR